MIIIHGPLSQRLHGCNWKVTWTENPPRAPLLPIGGKLCDTQGEVMQTIMLLMQQMERAEEKRDSTFPL